MNIVIFDGNLGNDPVLHETPGGKPWCTFTLYVPRKDASGDADPKRIAVWGKDAENCAKYLKKGSYVPNLEAWAKSSSYDDNDGKRRTTEEFVCISIKFPPKTK